MSSPAEAPVEVVVLAAANPWAVQRMADHQFAVALSAHVPVVYVDPSTSAYSRLRDRGEPGPLAGGTSRWVADGVLLLQPEGLPAPSRQPFARANSHLTALQVNRLLRRRGWRAKAVIEANLLSPILGLVPTERTVYWAQDDFVGMASLVGVDPHVYEAAEQRMERRADAVVAANAVVAAKVGRSRSDVALIPFGCDLDLFTASPRTSPATDVTGTGPRALLMGSVNDRLDLPLLEATADAGTSILVVGPRAPRYTAPAFDRLVARDDVQWLGERAFEDLPRYLAAADVGLVPYTHSPFNESSFPLKTLEYLAAGLPVVATDLPAIRWLDSADVAVADDPPSFAAAVARAAGQGRPADDAVRRRQAFAAGHSWAVRARAFAEVLGVVPRPEPEDAPPLGDAVGSASPELPG